MVGMVPNDAAVTRLVGAMLFAQTNEVRLNRRYIRLEGLQTLTDTAATRVPAVQRRVLRTAAHPGSRIDTTRLDTIRQQRPLFADDDERST